MRNPDARHKYTWRCKRRRPRRRLSENRQPRGDLMASDLKGKAVLITGASTGIGAAAARAFARLGSHVVVHYNASRDAAEKVAADVRSLGGEAVLVGGDVNEPANIKRNVGEAQAAPAPSCTRAPRGSSRPRRTAGPRRLPATAFVSTRSRQASLRRRFTSATRPRNS